MLLLFLVLPVLLFLYTPNMTAMTEPATQEPAKMASAIKPESQKNPTRNDSKNVPHTTERIQFIHDMLPELKAQVLLGLWVSTHTSYENEDYDATNLWESNDQGAYFCCAFITRLLDINNIANACLTDNNIAQAEHACLVAITTIMLFMSILCQPSSSEPYEPETCSRSHLSLIELLANVFFADPCTEKDSSKKKQDKAHENQFKEYRAFYIQFAEQAGMKLPVLKQKLASHDSATFGEFVEQFVSIILNEKINLDDCAQHAGYTSGEWAALKEFYTGNSASSSSSEAVYYAPKAKKRVPPTLPSPLTTDDMKVMNMLYDAYAGVSFPSSMLSDHSLIKQALAINKKIFLFHLRNLPLFYQPKKAVKKYIIEYGGENNLSMASLEKFFDGMSFTHLRNMGIIKTFDPQTTPHHFVCLYDPATTNPKKLAKAAKEWDPKPVEAYNPEALYNHVIVANQYQQYIQC